MFGPSWRGWLNRLRTPARPPRRRRPVRLTVEEFEVRLLPSLTVNTSGDDNDGGTLNDHDGPDHTLSLREAIELVNLGVDTTIDFSVSTVQPTSALPAITAGGVTITGSNVTIDGSGAGAADGLDFEGANNKVTGLTINDFQGTQLVFADGGNTIQGCFVGTNRGGTAAVGGGDGVEIDGDNNLIGGSGNGNVLSGCSDWQLIVTGNGNTIQGNFVGCNQGGTSGLGGGNGVLIEGASNTLGGLTSALANVISGNPCTNAPPAVAIHTSGATNNLVVGNFIGTDITGKKAIGNGSPLQTGTGISIGQGANHNTVGGTTSSARNIISANGLDGVAMGNSGTDANLVEGNYIGTDATGAKAGSFGNSLDGVDIYGGASSNTIGGSTSAAANVIAGSGFEGVSIYDVDSNVSSKNLVAGNFIGTDRTGSKALANQGDGVSIENGASNNTIGGTASGAINVISGNGFDGVFLGGSQGAPQTSDNVVEGNRIGTDLGGTMPLPNSVHGVEVNDGATGNTIGGELAVSVTGNVISANGEDGVLLSGTCSGNVAEGNLIGTDVNGTHALPNTANGVELSGAASGNTVGGTLGVADNGMGGLVGDGMAGTGNIISGNGNDGVLIKDDNTSTNLVEGNYIGTDVNGSVALGNTLHGVEVTGGASANTVGGALGDDITGNVISGNGQDGVVLSGQDTTENVVSGNYIGTDPNDATYTTTALDGGGSGGVAYGSIGLGNGDTGTGVLVTDDSSNNTIGGDTDGAGNLIAFNKHNGVNVESGTGNAIRADLLFDNGDSDAGRPGPTEPAPFLPIALGDNLTDLTPNTTGSHQGANNLQNYPIITISDSNSTNPNLVQGYLNSKPGTDFTVEVFALMQEFDGAGNLVNEGAQLLALQQVSTDGNGNAAFQIDKPTDDFPDAAAGDSQDITITGTATDSDGNTSEFGVPLTPAQIRTAYGINNLPYDGTGQTIAIVSEGNDPNLFVDLDNFDRQFGRTVGGPTLMSQYGAASSFMTVFNQGGGVIDPTTAAADPGIMGEEMMDVEWAHAIAPGARIDVVEGDDFLQCARTAGMLPGVSVVSISYGYNEVGAPQPTNKTEATITAAQELQDDPSFIAKGVTFLAASGDYGLYDKSYPAFSPTVVAVGGTTIRLNPDGTYGQEHGWGKGANSASDGGSGGGPSLFEHEPQFQVGVQATGFRTIPDVAMDAGTDVAVNESYNAHPGNPGWVGEGGTSLATPLWAGLIALVNQGRGAGHALNSTNPQETLQALYSLPTADFHPPGQLGGDNGAPNANLLNRPRYDELTGLGSPRADVLVPDLINYRGVSLTPTSLPAGSVGKTYSQTIVASGGNSDITVTYNVTSGGIPPGLSFTVNNNQLAISGTPTATGSVTFTVTATDTVGSTTQQSYTLTVNGLTLAPDSLPPGTVHVPYNQSIVASGGSGTITVTYAITSGAIPPGLTFAVNGNELDITGTPTATGSVSFTVTAKDTAGDMAQQSYTVTINASTTHQITFSPTSLPAGTVRTPYSQTVTASGGGGGPITLTYAIKSGSVPPGLHLAVQNNQLTITGTPTAGGSVTFTVTARDTAGDTAQQSYTLTVTQAGKHQITFTPTILPTGTAHAAYDQTITAAGGNGAITVTYLILSGRIPPGVTFAIHNNQLSITGTPTAGGDVTFVVNATDTAGDTAQQRYTLIIFGPTGTSPGTALSFAVPHPGQPASLTAAASGPPGGATPTGAVTSLDGGTPPAPVPLASGPATITTRAGRGRYRLKAVSAGDSTLGDNASAPPWPGP
jgi:hypothetical protein